MSTVVADVHVETHYRVGLARPILKNVRWTITRGEHWAVVGENGSGKSTLLSILSGDLWPSRGTIHVLGHQYGRVDKRELKKRIGVVSAAIESTFPASETALEMAASGIHARIGRLGATSDDDIERGRQALASLSADSLADKRFGVLSQGERQRVMIARALVNAPDLLVLDEPCTSLDPVARERFLRDLQRLAGDPGAPCQIHVTHHLEEIPPFITHALILRGGETVASGTADDVLTSEALSRAFDAPCEVTRETHDEERRYRLRVVLNRS